MCFLLRNSARVATARVFQCAYVLACGMAATTVDWFCPSCRTHVEGGHKICATCPDKIMLHCECMVTGWTGSYTNWVSRHRDACEHCSPDLAKKIEHERESKAHAKRVALMDTIHGTYHNSSFMAAGKRGEG